jgi:hypothetical protein
MQRRSLVRVVVPVVVLILSLLLPSAVVAGKSQTPDMTREVKTLIETYGPVIRFHPDEVYFLDMPEAVLDGPSQLVWGIVRNEDDPANFEQTILGSVETSANTLLADVAMAKQDANAGDPDFRYWLEIDESLRAGNLQRAKTYVRVLPIGDTSLDLQFWFFSPYNGPIKGRVTALGPEPLYFYPDTLGRHTGDWEHVTLRFTQGQAGTGWDLDQVFMSQHSGGTWIDADELTYEGTHPVIYAAKDSHAHYATVGEHKFDTIAFTLPVVGQVPVDLVDRTGDGATFASFHPGNYRIVSSELAGVKANGWRDWLEYDGLWGEYELLTYAGTITVTLPPYGTVTVPFSYTDVFNGPTGPAQKDAWYQGD